MMQFLTVLTLLILGNVIVIAFGLRLVASWRSQWKPSLWKCLIASVFFHLVAGLGWAVGTSILSYGTKVLEGPTLYFLVFGLAAWPPLYLFGSRSLLSTTVRWLAFGLFVATDGFFFHVLIDEYVLESSSSETQISTCPSVRGLHTTQKCSACGGEFVIPLFLRYDREGKLAVSDKFRKEGVCNACLHSSPVAEHVGPFHNPDHFVINHSLAPVRWSIVAFRGSKVGGRVRVVGRLVGLPGESVELKNGAVWLNGKMLEVPSGQLPFRFTDDVPRSTLDLQKPPLERCFAHQDEPLTLASDEYFVLCENPTSALDSRVYGPCGKDDYLGVVDVIFWPPSRWRLKP